MTSSDLRRLHSYRRVVAKLATHCPACKRPMHDHGAAQLDECVATMEHWHVNRFRGASAAATNTNKDAA